MKLRTYILLFLFLFAFTPLFVAFSVNLPMVLDRFELFYHKAHLQNLRADFRDLDQHLASRRELVSLLSKMPEPGTVLGQATEANRAQIEEAKKQYVNWINHILYDQKDVIQLAYMDHNGELRYALSRNMEDGKWQVTQDPVLPRTAAGKKSQPQLSIVISPISIKKAFTSTDPRFFMTLTLSSRILQPSKDDHALGSIIMTVDVGGIARYYRDTIWVQNSGQYLFFQGKIKNTGSAFTNHPGLEQRFKTHDLTLWEGDNGKQVLWIPLLKTTDGQPLWVGRYVDPSPISEIQWAISWRVASVMLALVFIVFFLAIRFARKAEKFDHELTNSITRILEENQPIDLKWSGPQEIQALANNLSRLSIVHADNTSQLINYSKDLEQKVSTRTLDLELARQHLAKIISNIGEALLVLDPSGKVKSSNPAASQMLGYTESELSGMSISDLFEEEGEEQAAAFMGTWLEALIRTGVIGKIDARFKHSDGKQIPIQFTRTAIKDENNEITDILCIAKDMSGFEKIATSDDTNND